MNKLGSRRWAALVIAGMLVAACSGATASPSAAPASEPAASSDASVAPSAEPSAAAQPFAGETINVSTYSSVTDFDFYKTILPEFEALTGIKVNYVQQPVAAMDQKIPLQLTAKDTSLDVFFTGSENIGSYIGIDGVEPLDAYIDDPALTPAECDFDDIAPAVEAACQNGGETYCIASQTGGGLLYYNTRMFQEAGITAPPAEPGRAARLRQAADHRRPRRLLRPRRQDPDAVRRVPALAVVLPLRQRRHGQLLRQGLVLPAVEGADRERVRDVVPARSPRTPVPEGIATYLVTNCLQDFQQGRVAMWHDDSGMIPEVLDPEKSLVAEETAFWSLPCQPVNPDHCALVQPFGTWINAASENKEAAGSCST